MSDSYISGAPMRFWGQGIQKHEHEGRIRRFNNGHWGWNRKVRRVWRHGFRHDY